MSTELSFINLCKCFLNIDCTHHFWNNVTGLTLFLVWRLFCTLLFHRIHFVTKKDNLLQVLLKQIVKVTFDQVLSVNLQKKALEKGAVSGIFFKIDFWQQVIFHLQNSYLSVLRTFWVSLEFCLSYIWSL